MIEEYEPGYWNITPEEKEKWIKENPLPKREILETKPTIQEKLWEII